MSPIPLSMAQHYVIDDNHLDEAVSKSTTKKYKILTKVGIYSLELVRQVSSIAAGILGAAGVAAACFGGVVTATVLAFTGLMTMGVAGLQSAGLWKDVKSTAEKVQTAKGKLDADQAANNGTVSPELKAAFEESQKASTIATLGFVNNCMFFGMGIGRISTCVVTILERLERVAHLVVFSAGAATAFVALHAAASVIYFARGAFLAFHAQKNITLINEFEKEWNGLTTIDEKIAFMKKHEALGQDYMDLRLDRKCLGDMTAQDCIAGEDKEKFVKLVDKAIFSQKLKHRIGRASGCLMMVGSILAAATLCVATGGIPFFALGAASALFFALAEICFIAYYHPATFEKVRDKLYTPKIDVQENPVQMPAVVEKQPVGPIEALVSPEENKPRETCCPNLGSFVKSTFDGLGWAYTKVSGAIRQEEVA